MKQQTANKIIAIFLAFTMLLSVAALFFSGGPGSEDENQVNTPLTNEEQEQALWTFNEPLISISDGLKITPAGVVSAEFIDLNSMTPQMMQWAKQIKVDLVNYPIIGWNDNLYNSSTSRIYYSHIKEGQNDSFLLLSNIYPQKINFAYQKDETGNPYKYYDQAVLVREDEEYKGLINIMGTPSIFAQWPTVETVLNITILKNNATKTAFDEYEGLLTYSEDAPYQMISSYPGFADQFYFGLRINNNSYERITAYLNLNSSSMKNLTVLKANSTQKGFTLYDIKQYNVSKTAGSELNNSYKVNQSYTVVKVAGPDFLRVLSEPTS